MDIDALKREYGDKLPVYKSLEEEDTFILKSAAYRLGIPRRARRDISNRNQRVSNYDAEAEQV